MEDSAGCLRFLVCAELHPLLADIRWAPRVEHCFVRRGTEHAVTALLFAVLSVPGGSHGGQYNTQI